MQPTMLSAPAENAKLRLPYLASSRDNLVKAFEKPVEKLFKKLCENSF
jgi:hypothetical protein